MNLKTFFVLEINCSRDYNIKNAKQKSRLFFNILFFFFILWQSVHFLQCLVTSNSKEENLEHASQPIGRPGGKRFPARLNVSLSDPTYQIIDEIARLLNGSPGQAARIILEAEAQKYLDKFQKLAAGE